MWYMTDEFTPYQAWKDVPDISTSTAENSMLEYVCSGVTPETAAMAAGIAEEWRQNTEFAAYINRVHAHNQARAEAQLFNEVQKGEGIPSGWMSFMKMYCGWHDKYGADGFSQNPIIMFREVNGRVTEQEEAAEKAKTKPSKAAKKKKDATKPSKKSKGR